MMPTKDTPDNSNLKKDASPPEEDNKYDFSNLTFEELLHVPVVEMSFRGEPLAGPDFFQLDFLTLQQTPVFLSPKGDDKQNNVGNVDDVNDDSYDFLALSFEDLLKVPVRLNRWQDGDDAQEPDIDSLSLADLMRLPVRRAFIADLDPQTLQGLLGDSAFSDLPSTDNGSGSSNSGNPLLYVGFGNNDKVTDTSPPIDNSSDNNSGSGSGGGFTTPPLNYIPSISMFVTAPADQLGVNESTLGMSTSANFADNFTFTSDFGNDGAGFIIGPTYALSIIAGPSGLVDVGTGQNIILSINNGVVEGRTEFGDTLVFTVSVNASGVVTLDQDRPIRHPDNTNPNDPLTLSADNLIKISATTTITDSNGDSATSTANLNIGQAINFDDDGPTILVSIVAPADIIIVDESSLGTSTSANFADNFNITSDFGGDGAGSLPPPVYTLSVIAGPSGLIDVATGQNVILSMNGGIVEGRTEVGNNLVFTLSVDGSGTVTLEQIRALQHPDSGNPDEAVTLNSADLIKITATSTITDRDGDSQTSSAAINIGNALSFKDDGPSILVNTVGTADILSVDETTLGTLVTANFADNFNITSSFGADNAGSLPPPVYTLSVTAGPSGLIDVATGQNVILSMNGGVVEGRTEVGNNLVFTLSVDGSGTVTLEQIRALQHPDSGNPDEAVTLSTADLIKITATSTITDRDGDTQTSSATLDIGTSLNFKDDGPSILVNTVGTADMLTVDESSLGTSASANFADNFHVTSNFGADGAGSLPPPVYTLSIIAGPSGLTVTDNALADHSVLLKMSGGNVVGYYNNGSADVTVFTLSVNASGNVTLTQSMAVKHPDTSNPDDAVTLSTADLIKITATSTITDRDGDSQTSSATIDIGTALSFKDDGPSILITAVGTPDILNVDETNLSNNASADFSDNFTVSPHYGADGAGQLAGKIYTLSTIDGSNSGLIDSSSNNPVLLKMDSGSVIGYYHDSNNDIDVNVFTLSVDSSSGIVTLDQARALQHPNGSTADAVVTLSAADLIKLTATDTITDKDGDSATGSETINIGTALQFHDDAPQAVNDTGFYAIKGGNSAHSSGNLLANDITGADSPLHIASITYRDVNNAIATANITQSTPANVMTYLGGMLLVNADGTYAYTPPAIDNSELPGTPDTIAFSYIAQDSDGSQSSANVDIKLYDAPKLSISDVEIVEGENVTAVFTVTLTGAIPSDLTIHYSTQDGSALAGQDYVGLSNIVHTFSASDLASQTFQVSVDIINDNIAEILENFHLVLDTSGTNINTAISDLSGNGNISDPDVLHITDVPAGTIDEADLSDGSSPNPPPITLSGNLLAGQDLGQIPLSNVALSNIGHPDGVTTLTSATATVTGSYFNLVVYLDDSTIGHVKGDYVYTLTADVDNVSGADFVQNIHFDVTPIDPGSSVDQSTRTDTSDLIIHIKDDAPQAVGDTGTFYAIKGGNSSHASDNLLTNDIPSADDPVKITSITYLNASNQSVTANVLSDTPLVVTPYYVSGATTPQDYTSVSGTINFDTLNVTSQQQTIQVPIIDDTDVEATENFVFTINDDNNEVNLNSTQAHNQADITILDNDAPTIFSLKATNDSPATVSEMCSDPSLPVTTAIQSGNVLANDTTGTVPSNLITVSKIEFIVDDLLANHPTLYQNYINQGATITPNANHYDVLFNVPSNNSILSISLPDNAVLKIQANGHYDFYQPQGGISQDTQYNWTYTITAPNAVPVNPGDDKGVLSINVQNEMVYANNDQVFTKGQLNFDLVLMLDISSGMNSTVNGTSRLALEKMAALNLINQYDAFGADLKITVIPFGSNPNNTKDDNYTGAFIHQTTNVADAINYINNSVTGGMINPDTNKKIGGGSEYDDALFHARNYLDTAIAPNSAIASYEHVVYFMSNGSPNSAATNLTPSWQSFINDPDNTAYGGVSGSPVGQINVIPVALDVSLSSGVINALNPIGNTNQSSEIVNLDYNGSQIVNLSSLYNTVSTNPAVTTNLLSNDIDTFDNVSGDLKVTQVSYFNPTLNTTLVYNLSAAHPQEVFTTAKGATVTINTDGTFVYQAGPGFTSPSEISEVFNYKMVNDCNIASNGQVSATTYNNNYTLVNLPGTPGNDSLNDNGVYNQGTVVMSGAGGNNTFTIDMGMSGLKANLIVIQDFAAGGNNTLKFINVQDANHDTVIQQSEIIAQITSVSSDSPYASGNVSFHLQNGTTVMMQNLGTNDAIAAPTTPTALISLIDEHGNVVGTHS